MGINIKNTNPIDAVILWVNGDDCKHKEKILSHSKSTSLSSSNEFNARFSQTNEIKFCIDSLLKFAPFLRTIHLITDDQTPDFLSSNADNNNYEKVVIVDHKEIFEGLHQHLPTFNSLSIETCIYRIAGLAEHFIYLNDDFFLINPTKPDDFFKDGLPILRGKWLKFDRDIFYKKFKKQRKAHKFYQQNAADLVDSKKYFKFFHTPHPLRKSTFENFFAAHENIFIENIKHKFRHPSQFTPHGLANHIEIKNDSCFLQDKTKLIYLRSYKKPLFWYQIYFKFKEKALFAGFQSLSECTENKLEFILDWLTRRLK